MFLDASPAGNTKVQTENPASVKDLRTVSSYKCTTVLSVTMAALQGEMTFFTASPAF